MWHWKLLRTLHEQDTVKELRVQLKRQMWKKINYNTVQSALKQWCEKVSKGAGKRTDCLKEMGGVRDRVGGFWILSKRIHRSQPGRKGMGTEAHPSNIAHEALHGKDCICMCNSRLLEWLFYLLGEARSIHLPSANPSQALNCSPSMLSRPL